MVDWPVMNSQRQDIHFDPFSDRSGDKHSDSIEVLPENERAQVRVYRSVSLPACLLACLPAGRPVCVYFRSSVYL